MSISSLNSSYSASGSYSSPLAMSGLATGMDTSTIVQELMSIAKQPEVNLQNQQTADNAKLSAYRDLNTKLSALQTAAQNLMGVNYSTSPLAAMQATPGNTAIFTATASNGATAASYTVNVSQLAAAQTNVYQPAAQTASTAGTITISDGTNSYNVAVNSGDSLATIASNINANTAIGMSAAVVTDPTSGTQSLILTGKSTGTNYTVTDSSGTLGSPTAASTAAQQAKATIDGIAVTSNTNTFSNIVNGVNLTAVSTGTSSLTVAGDTNTATQAVQSFVDAYNGVISTIKTDTAYDSSTKQGGVLLGDSFVENLPIQLDQQLSNTFTGGNSTYTNYTQIGISVQKDGTLQLDSSKLTSALQANPQEVFNLLAANTHTTTTDSYGQTVDQYTTADGIATRLSGFVDSMVNSVSMYNTTDGSGQRYAGGILAGINTFNTEISDLQTQIDSFNARLAIQEQTLKQQFASMESSVSSLRNQGNYLSGQFAQVASSTPSSPTGG